MAEDTALTRSEREEAWAAIDLIHEALGEIAPPGALPSQEEINRQYGPTFLGYAQPFVKRFSPSQTE